MPADGVACTKPQRTKIVRTALIVLLNFSGITRPWFTDPGSRMDLECPLDLAVQISEMRIAVASAARKEMTGFDKILLSLIFVLCSKYGSCRKGITRIN